MVDLAVQEDPVAVAVQEDPVAVEVQEDQVVVEVQEDQVAVEAQMEVEDPVDREAFTTLPMVMMTSTARQTTRTMM